MGKWGWAGVHDDEDDCGRAGEGHYKQEVNRNNGDGVKENRKRVYCGRVTPSGFGEINFTLGQRVGNKTERKDEKKV